MYRLAKHTVSQTDRQTDANSKKLQMLPKTFTANDDSETKCLHRHS